MSTFYAYLWLREDGTPYYVGKGRGDRCFVKYNHRGFPPSLDRIVVLYCDSEQEALALEVELIAFYGRKDLGLGCLRNFTNGGDGVSGYKQTEESNRKNSEWHKGKVSPRKGVKLSQETRDKLSKSHTGKSNGQTGQKRSDVARRNMSEAAKKRWAVITI